MYTDKNSDVRNNDMIRNNASNSNKNLNNFNKNLYNDKVNNIDKYNNTHNVKLCYNQKLHQSAHLIQKCGEYFPYAI